MDILDCLLPVVSSYQFWILALVTYFLFRKRRAKRYNLPPRPYSWPIIGNMYHVLKGDPILYKWCQKVAKEVGPVFRVSFGFMDAIVLNDIETTQKAMHLKGNDFNGRMKSRIFETLSNGYNDVVMVDADHPTFKPRRKLLATTLRNFTFGGQFETYLESTLEKMCKLFDPLAETLQAFDPESYCKLLSYNLFASMCFRKGYEMNDPEFISIRDMFQKANDSFNPGITISDIPFAKHLPFDLWDVRQAKYFRDQFVNVIEAEVQRCRRRMEDHDIDGDLIAYILKTRKEDGKEGMDKVTDEQIVQLIADIFKAGVDTVQMTLRWILMCMALYPDIQGKAYHEIVENVQDDVYFVSAIEYRAKMTYTEAVVLETTRFGTIGPFGFPHCTLADTKIDEYDIPKDTMVLVNQWAIHNDEKDFPDPEEFIPERFMDKDGDIRARPRGFIPFGIGRRACPGELVARTTVWIVFTSLLKRYRILPPQGVNLRPEYKDNAFEGAPKPFQIVLQKRD